MKYLHILLALIFIFAIYSCDEDNHILEGNGEISSLEIPVEEFSNFTADFPCSIFLSKSDKPSVTIETDDNLIELFNLIRNGNDLRLTLLSNAKLSKCNIYLSTKDYNLITINGSGNIANVSNFEDYDISLRLYGNGNIRLNNIEISNLQMYLSGSGNIYVSGNSNHALAEIGGSGNIDLQDLKAYYLKAVISNSGNINAWAINELYARILGSGNINLFNTPATVDTQISGSGKIKLVGG